nr:hypothetical protein Iba_chr02aCG10550 [Ipomoea batatas]
MRLRHGSTELPPPSLATAIGRTEEGSGEEDAARELRDRRRLRHGTPLSPLHTTDGRGKIAVAVYVERERGSRCRSSSSSSPCRTQRPSLLEQGRSRRRRPLSPPRLLEFFAVGVECRSRRGATEVHSRETAAPAVQAAGADYFEENESERSSFTIAIGRIGRERQR